ncbi:hypothetical protein Shyhy02_59720 [Streptomyces hygroscopicus subsp. hygroscopicus]|nr:hypothetical protein Shyhy02_59720 [Streptomyces hygroscopicus subsp. hygroscopicus]
MWARRGVVARRVGPCGGGGAPGDPCDRVHGYGPSCGPAVAWWRAGWARVAGVVRWVTRVSGCVGVGPRLWARRGVVARRVGPRRWGGAAGDPRNWAHGYGPRGRGGAPGDPRNRVRGYGPSCGSVSCGSASRWVRVAQGQRAECGSASQGAVRRTRVAGGGAHRSWAAR